MSAPDHIAAGPLEGLVQRYLGHLQVERGVAPNTRQAYGRDLRLYLEFLDREGVAEPEKITEDHVAAFLEWLRGAEFAPGRRYSDATVARVLAAVRGLHRYLHREGETRLDAAEHVGSPRVSRALPKALDVAEVRALIEAADGESAASVRDRAILEILYAAGLRISELTALDAADLDLGARTVRCLGKGARERVVPIGGPAAEALAAYTGTARPALARGRLEPALFLNARGRRLTRQGCWKLIKKYADLAELARRISPHTLRHSFATHLIDGGADVRSVQELLGHAGASGPQAYTKVNRDRLRSVYDSAHPRSGRPASRRP